MDRMDKRFDGLTRNMANGVPRRQMLRGLLAGFGGALLSGLIPHAAMAGHCPTGSSHCQDEKGVEGCLCTVNVDGSTKTKCCHNDKPICCTAIDTGEPMCCPRDTQGPGGAQLTDGQICVHSTRQLTKLRCV
jgi:hypothetical protein